MTTPTPAEQRADFPAGPGVTQGPVSGQKAPIGPAAALNTSDAPGIPRPQPTDPSGTNDAGWMKTQDYPSAGYDVSTGVWKQV
jgi:hypothetical protein